MSLLMAAVVGKLFDFVFGLLKLGVSIGNY